jgi:uncharacterized membrane protein
MDTDIVIVVRNETDAYQTLTALRRLDDDGSIELHASAVITKDSDGTVKLEDKNDDTVGWGTLLGLSTGTLIGLLAGPVGLGAAIGGSVGLAGDAVYTGFSSDFIQRVGERLQPGASAVIASAFEDWTTPVDMETAQLGGKVFRESSSDVASAQLKSDMRGIEDELSHVRTEIQRSSAETKQKLEAKRTELEARAANARKRAEDRAKQMEQRVDDEIASIKQKLATSRGEARERHQRHMEKLSQFNARQKQAFEEMFH